MPKYIWVAKCSNKNKLLFEIIFDATDVAIGMFGFAIYFHNNSIKETLGDFISKDNEKSANVFQHACKTQFANFILEEAKRLLLCIIYNDIFRLFSPCFIKIILYPHSDIL